MIILYHPISKGLIFISHEATPEFWDKIWVDSKSDFLKAIIDSDHSKNFVVKTTKKYIHSKNSMILEGGCGRGQNVISLAANGYSVIGVDYAEKTVEILKFSFPNIDFRFSDVRKLDFPNHYFDGYWSLGVIEHFWEGYNEILSEASRVVKLGGFFFITFPYFSPMRQFKNFFGLYKLYDRENKPECFYQFALNKKKVIKALNSHGFKLISQISFDVITAINYEHQCLKRLIHGDNFFLTLVRFFMEKLFRKFLGNTILLITQKQI